MSDISAVHETSRPHPIKRRMIEFGVTNESLGLRLKMSPSLISRYLRGVRPMPEGFESRCHLVLDLIEKAEIAAAEARARVWGEE